MNAKPDWNLIFLSCLISFCIFLNYFFWSVNFTQIIKSINFFTILFFLFYFFIGKKFKNYNYLRLFIISLLVLSLGSVTVDWDARSMWAFHAKRIFLDDNLYAGFDKYMPELMNAYPLLPASLSATLAQIIGHWNEIYPKSTNVLVLLPALFVQCSFLKNNKSILLWLMFTLLFLGRALVSGLMDGLVAMYFVTNCLIIYNLFFEENSIYGQNSQKINKNKNVFFLLGIFCGIILSLLKNEGLVMVILLLLSAFLFKIYLKKKIRKREIIFGILVFIPIFIWKSLTAYNGIYPAYLGSGNVEPLMVLNSFDRIILRLGEINNYKLVFKYLLLNEKFIIALLIFLFSIYKGFEKNKLIYSFVIVNALTYHIVLHVVYFSTTQDLYWLLSSSSTRVVPSIVMILVFFSVSTFMKKKE
jgi:hypothetical protein